MYICFHLEIGMKKRRLDHRNVDMAVNPHFFNSNNITNQKQGNRIKSGLFKSKKRSSTRTAPRIQYTKNLKVYSLSTLSLLVNLSVWLYFSAISFHFPFVSSYNWLNENVTESLFSPYEKGFVDRYGDPNVFQRERVNEGAPATEEQPRIWEGVNPRQLCPNMVGPLNGVFYCRGREYGYCDQRSGVCFCNMGYTGLGCEQCSPTHYLNGDICYPKLLCPGDCSGGGTCDFSTGTCICDPHRTGEDCSIPVCTTFDPFCVECTNSECLSCIQGYSIEGVVGSNFTCKPCSRFDPRCTFCDAFKCLGCSDPLLLSIRRSGARYYDQELPKDEMMRSLSKSFPFGTQRPDFFDEAELFLLDKNGVGQPLNQSTKACHQGIYGDTDWTCESAPLSHQVCGHSGTITFSSSTYQVTEGNDDFIRITVERTGGGMGEVSVKYDLEHLTTDDSDVHPTAYYTSVQELVFEESVVKKSFLLTINDDSEFEGEETFALHLFDARGGSSLGVQKTAIVTIVDNDQNKTSYHETRLYGKGITQELVVAGEKNEFMLDAKTENKEERPVGGDIFWVELSQMAANRASKSDSFNDNDDIPGVNNIHGYGSGSTAGINRNEHANEDSIDDYGGVDLFDTHYEGNNLENLNYFGHDTNNKHGWNSIYKPVGDGNNLWHGAPCEDLNNGSYSCFWVAQQSGDYRVRVSHVVPHGLNAYYYNDAFFQDLVFQRVDHVVNFTWGEGRLTPVATDFVTVRWVGRISPNKTDEYSLYVEANDHARLWIDRSLVIDQWDEMGPLNSSTCKVNLTENYFHHVVLEYRERRGEAEIKLKWSSNSLEKSIIPQLNLFRDNELDQSPYYMKVVSTETDPYTTYAEGKGLVSGIAGDTFRFVIRPHDIFGNARDDGLGLGKSSYTYQQMANGVEKQILDEFDPYYRNLYFDVLSQDMQNFHAEAILVENKGQGKGPTIVPSTISFDDSSSTLVVEYTPLISGTYQLNVTYANTTSYAVNDAYHIRGSPFTVDVAESKMFPRTATLQGTGLSGGVAGTPLNFTILARDLYNNIRHIGGDAIDVYAHHENEQYYCKGDLIDLGNGSYHVTVLPEKKGYYNLEIFAAVRGTTENQYGARSNPLFTTKLTSNSGGGGIREVYMPHNNHFENRNNFDSETNLDSNRIYTHMASDFSVESFADHMGESPYRIHIEHSTAYGPTSYCWGPGIEWAIVDYHQWTVLETYDQFMNHLDYGAANISIKLVSTHHTVYGSITDYGNGSYYLSYNPIESGDNYLFIAIEGEQINGSPFLINVEDGDTLADTTTARGEALYNAEAGVLAKILITARDTQSNLRTSKSDHLNNTIDGPAFQLTMNVNVKDTLGYDVNTVVSVQNSSTYQYTASETQSSHRDNLPTHEITYNATVAGVYNLTILEAYNLKDIVGSPFTPYIRPARGEPWTSKLSGIGLAYGMAGFETFVQADSYDAFGNHLDRGGDLYVATLFGPLDCREPPCGYENTHELGYMINLNEEHYIRSSRRSSYLPTYTKTSSNTLTDTSSKRIKSIYDYNGLMQGSSTYYNLTNVRVLDDVAVNRLPIATSQRDILLEDIARLREPPGPSVKDLETDIIYATQNSLHLKNGESGHYGHVQSIPVHSFGNGTFTLSYTPKYEGTYELQVKMGTKGQFWATYYSMMGFRGPLEGFPIHDSDLTDTWQSNLGPISSFKFANQSIYHFDSISAIYRGFIVPELDADYHFSVDIDTASTFTMSLGDIDIFPKSCCSGKRSFSMQHEETGLTKSIYLKAGVPYPYVITFQHTEGERPSWKLWWEYQKTERTPNGKISTSFIREVIPARVLYLFYLIDDTTHYPYIEPGPINAATSTAVGDGLFQATAGEETFFILHVRDKYGNLRLSGGDMNLHVRGRGRQRSHDFFGYIKEDYQNGTYLISYTVPVAGDYTLSITLNEAGASFDVGVYKYEESLSSAHIDGSPFNLKVVNNDISYQTTTLYGPGTYSAIAGEIAYAFLDPRDINNNLITHMTAEELLSTKRTLNQPTIHDEDYVDIYDDNLLSVALESPTYNASTSINATFSVISRSSEDQATVMVEEGEVDLATYRHSGIVKVNYETKKSGRHFLRLFVNGTEAYSSPYYIQVSPAPAYGIRSTASVPTYGYNNSYNEFYILLVDEFGNPQVRGGEFIQVKIVGPEILYPPVNDMGNGYYQVEFTPRKLGLHLVHINLCERKPLYNPSNGLTTISGLTGQYFDNTYFEGFPYLTRVDRGIDTALQNEILANNSCIENSCSHLTPPTSFSVQWKGFLYSPLTDEFDFSFEVGEGSVARLFLGHETPSFEDHNMVLEVDGDLDDPILYNAGPLLLKKGRVYDIVIEFVHEMGNPEVKLFWESRQTPRQIIPSYFFSHSATPISGSPYKIIIQ